jgi:hypothetical protein
MGGQDSSSKLSLFLFRFITAFKSAIRQRLLKQTFQ